MKLLLLPLSILCFSLAFGQKKETTYNKWSIDANVGLNKAVRNFTPNYAMPLLGIGNANFGVRRMFNPYFGLDLKLTFDKFQDNHASPDFSSNFGQLNLNGIVNVGNMLHFHEWTERIGLLGHAGLGVGNFVDKGFPSFFKGMDKVGSISFGLAPQFKLTEKLALRLDATVYGLAKLHHTFDYKTPINFGPQNTKGLNGQYFTGTIGISYYLGKKERHADWSPTKSVNKEDLDALRAELEKTKKAMADDDKDGVPNYLDEEQNTPENTAVNLKGITDLSKMDSDQDGIADQFDLCPKEKGSFSSNGCPDKDNDGVSDAKDKCPDVAGSLSNNGCPEEKMYSSGAVNLDPGLDDVFFAVNSSALTSNETKKIDEIVSVLKSNPDYKLTIKGHADKTGSFEFNQILSEKRAQSVKNYLVKKGVNPAQIETFAYSFNEPISNDNSAKGNAQNRRVSFEVKK